MKNNNQRQNGVQEVNIVGIVNKITKFSLTIKNKNNVTKILNMLINCNIEKTRSCLDRRTTRYSGCNNKKPKNFNTKKLKTKKLIIVKYQNSLRC